jgi:Glycosyl hydrolases family 18.
MAEHSIMVCLKGDVESLVRGMKASGAKLMLSVFLQDAAITDKLLGSPQAIDGVVAQMTRDWGIKYYNYNDGTSAYVLDDSGRVVEYDGIIVDFEGLTAEDKEGFNAFLDKLRDAMPAGKTLGVCVQPKRKPGIAYYDGYDYAHIGKVADQVILMAHDYQKDRASTPASAPYDLVKEAVEFAISEIPPQKILLQVSLAPVQWTKGKGTYNFTTLDAMQKALDGQVPGQKVLYATPKDERYDPVYRTGWAYLKRQLADGTVQEDDFYLRMYGACRRK